MSFLGTTNVQAETIAVLRMLVNEQARQIAGLKRTARTIALQCADLQIALDYLQVGDDDGEQPSGESNSLAD